MKRRSLLRDTRVNATKKRKENEASQTTSEADTRATQPISELSTESSQESRPHQSEMIVVDSSNNPKPFDAVAYYREWRKSGSIHDNLCYVCRLGGDLLQCNTCRLSYHASCLEDSDQQEEPGQPWHCPICVARNWHNQPPSLTPPSTPPTSHVFPVQARQSDSIDPESTRLGNQNSTLQESALSSYAGTGVSPPAIPHSDNPTFSNPSFQNPTSTESSINRKPTGSGRGRRSKFSTLETDVESALSVLYRELELSNSLQQEIRRLRQELKSSQQESQITKNQLAMFKSEAESARASTAELTRLKAELLTAQRDSGEVLALREDNKRLGNELRLANEAMVEKDATLETWKAKLKGLLDG